VCVQKTFIIRRVCVCARVLFPINDQHPSPSLITHTHTRRGDYIMYKERVLVYLGKNPGRGNYRAQASSRVRTANTIYFIIIIIIALFFFFIKIRIRTSSSAYACSPCTVHRSRNHTRGSVRLLLYSHNIIHFVVFLTPVYIYVLYTRV